MKKEKVYLMILDGLGKGKKYKGNAVEQAKMPNFKKLQKEYPSTLIKASGIEVGLPKNTMGNSEVGHYTIGAGKIVFQSFEEINQSIKNKSFFKNKALIKSFNLAKEKNLPLHLIGMISDEGVHSHIKHLFALLKMSKQKNINKIYIHAITDGRDVPEKSTTKYIKQIEDKIKELKLNTEKNECKIATIIGRYYAMDRDNNWDRTKIAYDLYTKGKGIKESNAISSIKNEYKKGTKTDYYINPIILEEKGIIKDKEPVIFFNFRTDRPKQLTKCFTHEQKVGFNTNKKIKPDLTIFGKYSSSAKIAFKATKTKENLPKTLEKHKKTQLHITETEKYPHVTFFFNSQNEEKYKNEKRIMIDSPKVPSYDLKPEMSAREITKTVLKELDKNYDFIIQNFANCDLVGHSGDLSATIKACEVIDECLGKIVKKAQKKDYHIIITADHGNAEYMIYEKTGKKCPSHTTSPVPFILVSEKYKKAKLCKKSGLKNIAPTILEIMNIQKPQEMTSKSIIL